MSFGIVASFVEFPISDAPPSLKLLVVLLLLAAFLAIAVGRLVWTLSTTFGPADIPSVRLGGLIGVIVLLSNLLAQKQHRPPLLATLIDIRRLLVLDDLDDETARKQTDIALRGMSVSDILQEHTKDFLEAEQNMAVHMERANSYIQKAASTLRCGDTEIGRDEEITVNALMQSSKTALDRADNEQTKAIQAKEKLLKGAIRLQKLVPLVSRTSEYY
jgi:hypothetical protein